MELRSLRGPRLRRVFLEGFSAMDIAEPLVSFDIDADPRTVQEFMSKKDYDLVGVRRDGLICGYVRQSELTDGPLADHLCSFSSDDLVPDTANLTEVVRTLSVNERCFVTILDRVGAIITLTDLEKPPMRMFLFGMITITEMLITEIIRKRYSEETWQALLSEDRLTRARDLQAERARRGHSVDLIECLQFGDKGWIVTYDEDLREALGQTSRKAARKTVKELETLRNNLAHTQEIIPMGWQRIITACERWEINMQRIIKEITTDTGE